MVSTQKKILRYVTIRLKWKPALTTRMQRRAEPFAPRRRNARGNAMAPSEENRPALLSTTVTAATVASESSQLLSAISPRQFPRHRWHLFGPQ